jgi:serine/threonine protein kinase
LLSFSPSPELWGIDPSRPAQERYRILGQIASGGMAEIYLAHMTGRGGVPREVVLKRLRPELQHEDDFVKMFYDEARIASQMDHPNIVRIYELGELDGSLFIAMELVPGVTLRDILTRLMLRHQRLPISIVLYLAIGALEALDYAHRRLDSDGRPLHIVHRDVSPQNILVSYHGEVKLLDFGVAKAERKFHKTMPGLVKGKFAYMAPEQIRGDHVDARADVFALGETLYEAALGRHPFQGVNDAAVLASIMHKVPSDPAKVDPKFLPAFAKVLLRALEKDAKLRFANADVTRLEIERTLSSEIATREELKSYLCDLFADAHRMLVDAREKQDPEKLVEALRLQDFAEKPQVPDPTSYFEEPTIDLPRTILRQVDDPSEPVQIPRRASTPRVRSEERPPFQDTPPFPEPPPRTIGQDRVDSSDLDRAGRPPDSSDLDRPPDSDDLERPMRLEAGDVEPPNPSGVGEIRRVRGASGVQDPDALLRRTDPRRDDRPPEVKPRKLREPTTGEHNVDPKNLSIDEIGRPTKKSGSAKLGRYGILRYWRSSGVTESFLAKEEMPFGLDRTVVLRRLAPERAQDQPAIDALAREGRLHVRLNHPNLVQLIEFGVHRSEPYLATEWIDGYTLREIFIQCHLLRREMPIGIACRIASSVAAALFSMHIATDREGQIRPIAHRSVTPDAIWVSKLGIVKLSDFGTAVEVDGEIPPFASHHPRSAVYVAPEGVGRRVGSEMVRADVYSAGVVFLESVIQEHLASSTATLEEIVHQARDGKIEAPLAHPDAKTIVLQAIARGDRERFSSAHAMEVEIERFLLRVGQPVTSQHVASWIQRLFSRQSSRP